MPRIITQVIKERARKIDGIAADNIVAELATLRHNRLVKSYTKKGLVSQNRGHQEIFDVLEKNYSSEEAGRCGPAMERLEGKQEKWRLASAGDLNAGIK
ncbi:MAG: hypothetical protein Q9217_004878 [Psora testacea]